MTDLLTDLRQLRARTRADRHAHAFPLLLLGGLVIAAPLLHTPAVEPDHSIDGWDPRVDGSNVLVRVFRTTAGEDPAHATLIARYWLERGVLLGVVSALFTMAAVTGRRTGVAR